LTGDQLLTGLRWMMLSRAFDERAIALQRQGRFGVHAPLTGQEAAVVGSALALDRQRDWLVPTYREMVGMAMHGLGIQRIFAMYMGRQAAGRIPDSVRVLPVQGAIATQLPHAAGLAWGLRLQGQDGAVLVYLGEGASSEGDFHEACNLAGVVRAPLVFLLMDNAWAISTPRSRQSAAASLADRAAGYGMRGVSVDGNDLGAVHKAVVAALGRARQGRGPSLLECRTYRIGFHNTTDNPRLYADEAGLEAATKADPIIRLQRLLRRRRLWSASLERRWPEEIAAELDDALAWAEAQEIPSPADALFDSVYASPPERLLAQKLRV
jgi:pyruvate dehydrogenase E1 component alpha subunit